MVEIEPACNELSQITFHNNLIFQTFPWLLRKYMILRVNTIITTLFQRTSDILTSKVTIKVSLFFEI